MVCKLSPRNIDGRQDQKLPIIVRCVPCMCEVLGLTPRTTGKKENEDGERKEVNLKTLIESIVSIWKMTDYYMRLANIV